jgi:hypothetical protein
MKPQTNDSTLTRVAVLETTVSHINETLARIETKMDYNFDYLNKKMDSKFEALENRFTKIDNRLWSSFMWTVTAFAGVFLMLAKIKGWI